MLWRNRTVLGIDIGTHSIKVIEMASVRGELMVLHGALLSIPPEDPDFDIALQLRQYLDRQNIRTRRAVIAVPATSGEAGESDHVVWQLLERPEIPPNVKPKDLRSALALELEDFIAYPPEDAIFDAQVLYPTPDGTGSVIVLVIAPRSLVEQRLAILHQASLQPLAVDLDFFAFERLAEYTGQLRNEGQTALVEVGDQKTAVGFYQGRRLRAIFDFQAGGRNITAELQRNLQLDHLDAEEAKHTRVWIEHANETPDEQDSLLEAIAALGPQAGYVGEVGTWRVDPAIENAIDDQRFGFCPPLRACFDAYETDFPDAQVATMVLAGGTAQLFNFPELLMDRFGLQVEKIAYADRVLWNSDSQAVRIVQANEPMFAVAMGLAMKTLAYKRPTTEAAAPDEAGEGEDDRDEPEPAA